MVIVREAPLHLVNTTCLLASHFRYTKMRYGPVAQLVRAPPCHGGGREFESLLGRLWDLSSAGRASALQAEGHRFEPCRSHRIAFAICADVAQLAEQLICNQQVFGSSPNIGISYYYSIIRISA